MKIGNEPIMDCVIMDKVFPFKYGPIIPRIVEIIRILEGLKFGQLLEKNEVIKRMIGNTCAG